MKNPAAFPLTIPPGTNETNEGMTLRDYFAAAALTGIKANDAMLQRLMDIADEQGTNQQTLIARMAYVDADAMLKAREGESE